ncbi:MAG: hypothetical protein VW600_06440 [Ferrovibrio sp.]
MLLSLILLVLHAQAVAALAPAGMAATVAFAQVLAALLAAAIERALEYNFSIVHQAEAVTAILLQGIFAWLLFRRLLVLLGERTAASPAVPHALGTAFAQVRKLYGASPLRHLLMAEWAYGILTVWIAYHAVMLVAAGRYRDFPIDYFLLPVAGVALLQLIAALFGKGSGRGLARIALATTFTEPQAGIRAQGRFGWEVVLVFLLLCLPVLVLGIETLRNREAIYWCAITVCYAVPLLGNLLMAQDRAGDKAIALSALSG